jgi:tRNA threonylcarbamoyladenosine biosynthesis protein TsaB
VILSLDTSTRRISLAIFKGGEIHTRTYEGKEKHAVKLAPILRDFLTSSKTSLNELELIGLGVGPGSLTGLRIGISYALGVAAALNIKIVLLDSFEVIAEGVVWPWEKVVVRKARKGYVYIQIFSEHPSRAEVLSTEEARKIIENLKDPLLVGDGKELFEGHRAPDYFDSPDPHVLLNLTMERMKDAVDYLEVKPMYVQKSIAEINYERRMKDEKGV